MFTKIFTLVSLCLLFCAAVDAYAAGSLINNPPDYWAAPLQAERDYWYIPRYIWNGDMEACTQAKAQKCDFNDGIDQAAATKDYAAQQGRPTSGIDPAFGVSVLYGASYGSPNISTRVLFNRTIYDCKSDACPGGESDCGNYKQVVWLASTFLACSAARCGNDSSPFGAPVPWNYLVCYFNVQGNYNGGPTWGQDQAKICARDGTYTPPPPPPAPTCQPCTLTATGDTSLATLGPVTCATVVNGNLMASEDSTLSVTKCALGPVGANGTAQDPAVQVNGGLDFGSNTILIVLDMENEPGIVPEYLVPILHFKAIAGNPTFKVQTYGVVNSQYQLCASSLRTTSNLYVRFYDCAAAPAPGQAPPLPAGSTLPDGSSGQAAQSGPGAASASAPASAAGQGGGGNGGSSKFPQWWHIILIIIACIIVLAILIILVVIMVVKCMKDDDDYDKMT